jgi:hypothetical protein
MYTESNVNDELKEGAFNSIVPKLEVKSSEFGKFFSYQKKKKTCSKYGLSMKNSIKLGQVHNQVQLCM